MCQTEDQRVKMSAKKLLFLGPAVIQNVPKLDSRISPFYKIKKDKQFLDLMLVRFAQVADLDTKFPGTLQTITQKTNLVQNRIKFCYPHLRCLWQNLGRSHGKREKQIEHLKLHFLYRPPIVYSGTTMSVEKLSGIFLTIYAITSKRRFSCTLRTVSACLPCHYN